MGKGLRWWQRWYERLSLGLRLARVDPRMPGRPADGLVSLGSSGTDLDKTWEDLAQEFADAREAWRRNALARRLISLVSSFVCGDGITLTSDAKDLAAFLAEFWAHPQNRMALRQYALCEELARSGELFVTLHMNPADGMSYVRPLPASSIDRVVTAAGDYETELEYHEAVPLDDPDYPAGRTWRAAAAGDQADDALLGAAGDPEPVCLHFAINRPVGCVRGESDLAPILPWLRRYSRWLEDRTMLNAAVRSFLWVVRVPGDLVDRKKLEYSTPPDGGTVMVIDRENEDWQAVAPALHAADAQADGRAIRWMIVAGGPGVGLVDMGEGEEANLATAKAMGEQRSRFMRARQQYFGWALATIALTAYNRAVRLGKIAPGRGGPAKVRTLADVRIGVPDISPADNAELGQAAAQLAAALAAVGAQGLGGQTWRRLVVRAVLKYAGEGVDDAELTRILKESEAETRQREGVLRGAEGVLRNSVGAEGPRGRERSDRVSGPVPGLRQMDTLTSGEDPDVAGERRRRQVPLRRGGGAGGRHR